MGQLHEARRNRAASVAASAGADAALVTSSVNVRYLTGLVSSNAAVLIPVRGTAVLGTDSRYAGTAERECEDVELLIERDVESALVAQALADGLRTLAFEDREMTVRRYRELTDADGAVGAGRELALVPVSDAIDELRIVKDESEISLLARACTITSEAFTAVLDRLRPGVTE